MNAFDIYLFSKEKQNFLIKEGNLTHSSCGRMHKQVETKQIKHTQCALFRHWTVKGW